MRATLQPIVEFGQQLIVGWPSRTLLDMVLSRDDAKQGFAQRLNEALSSVPGCPAIGERGRAAWVAKKFRISNEGASKWLDGRAIPDMTNVVRICDQIGVTPQWLLCGQYPKSPQKIDRESADMAEIWATALGPADRLELLRFARFRAGRSVDSASDGGLPPPPRAMDRPP